MTRVLITGMSGTGKSSVIAELSARGYRAIDLDSPQWSVTRADGEWVWREDRVRELLSDDAGDVLFVSGCASNQGKFYSRFDHVVLLSAAREVILERLETRTTNPFGKRPEEVAQVLGDLAETEPLLRRVAHLELDTTAPLGDVVEAILQLTR
jgi:shikimate kinase